MLKVATTANQQLNSGCTFVVCSRCNCFGLRLLLLLLVVLFFLFFLFFFVSFFSFFFFFVFIFSFFPLPEAHQRQQQHGEEREQDRLLVHLEGEEKEG